MHIGYTPLDSRTMGTKTEGMYIRQRVGTPNTGGMYSIRQRVGNLCISDKGYQLPNTMQLQVNFAEGQEGGIEPHFSRNSPYKIHLFSRKKVMPFHSTVYVFKWVKWPSISGIMTPPLVLRKH